MGWVLAIGVVGGCGTTGGSGARFTAAQIMDACTRTELPAAREKYKSEADPEGSAKAYVEMVCQIVAGSCSRDPSTPPCQSDLKRYGLIP